jgi:hypothetical protein
MQPVASTRPSSTCLRRNLCDGATCTTRRRASSSLQARLENPSQTCFYVKQAAISRCMSRADLPPSVLWHSRQIEAHLILRPKPRNHNDDFETQITKSELSILRPKLRNPPPPWFWGLTKKSTTGFEAKPGETIACFALGPLILLGVGGVVVGEVKVAEGSTRSGHHLLKLLILLLVFEAVLLLTLALVAGVVPVVVVVIVGGVEFLPLGAVGDEVGGVAALETAPRRSPLLAEPMQSSELSRQQGDLIIRDALVLLIRSCTQGRQSKL